MSEIRNHSPTNLSEEVFELPRLNSIPVTKELLVEAGFDMNTSWEDGRHHLGIAKDPILFDLKLVAPNGVESRFLTISIKEVRIMHLFKNRISKQ